ncbi:dTDP-4-dehydrorhamnose reductase [Acetivibrio clariflavus]|uniref:dTDP-4-dehydrorhamnose reductase n=1 Tax=Acetivibrio clariflavus (strain DSM 19732 / NBRC 101661 / EBR45) TaxID=720554 RepID=G8LSM8_ACECE|nr:dTDP-4-dehydrorhamnose reductase [Acetivibrio clariflavus]AEV69380.1 dTDP-4-dehydrorhamnose reductase [Acetivibrio clariflavus DSM 19732]HOP99775.1 dTDP-4-dehydrorhamnose reductase [Acetivibrio clariflavus]
MKIIVTGSQGQLGKEILKQLDISRYDITAVGKSELNIAVLDDVVSMFRAIKPDVVINCAAYTNVDACETDFDTAFKVNAIGPRNLAIASGEVNAKIVHISTDYVFDGKGVLKDGSIRPYVEYDIAHPETAYGKTKLEGENFVKLFNNRHFIIRTAWLYGEGKNFVRTMLELSQKNGVYLKVVNDQRGTPTSTEELAGMIRYLIDTDNYGLFHGTCEGQCTWYEFTREIFRIKGITTEVIPCTTQEYPRPAPRPAYSVLENYMLKLTSNYMFRDWREALEIYLRKLS